MITPLLSVLGIPAGFAMIGRIRAVPPSQSVEAPSLSIIVPARNEERNLPRLLASIASCALRPAQVLVVDDDSSDNTAGLARALGASVLPSQPLPPDWSGKTWACFQGAVHASGDLLLFLDADTWFVPGGLDRLVQCWAAMGNPSVVLSLLPWHTTTEPYEQLSLFFNLLMASAGFGAFARPRLFGQSLLIAKDTYFAAGGHATVRGAVLENFSFADPLRRAGARLVCLAGAGTLHMRMFPHGFRQMFESWSKGFAQGAARSAGFIVLCSVAWISALCSTVVLLLAPGNYGRTALLIAYLLLSLQLAWLSRRLGNFHLLTSLLYPIPLVYFCAVFGVSVARRALGRRSYWRGRDV